MVKQVLVGTDGSGKASEAVALAANIARAFGARLTIVHVLFHGLRAEEASRFAESESLAFRLSSQVAPHLQQTPETMNELMLAYRGDVGQLMGLLGDRICEDAAESARSLGVTLVDTRVEVGEYAATILAIAEEIGADLIVVGSRGLGRLKGLLVGSVSQKIAQHAHCSVLLVR